MSGKQRTQRIRLTVAILTLALAPAGTAQVFTSPVTVHAPEHRARAVPSLRVDGDAGRTTLAAWLQIYPAGSASGRVSELMFSSSSNGSPFTAAESLAADSTSFAMAVTGGGEANVVFTSPEPAILMYRRRPAGSGFLPPVQITQEGWTYTHQIAADGNGRVALVWRGNVNGVFCTAISGSVDSGLTFSTPRCLGQLQVGLPRVAFDGQGRVHIVYSSYSPSAGFSMHHTRATDMAELGTGAVTQLWEGPQAIVDSVFKVGANGEVAAAYRTADPESKLLFSYSSGGLGFTTREITQGIARMDLAMDEAGGVHLVWDPRDMGNAGYVYSANGVDFEDPVAVSRVEVDSQRAALPRLAVDRQGIPNVVWYLWDIQPEQRTVYFSRAADRREFVTQQVAIPPSLRPREPELAVDGQGRITVMWREEKSGSTEWSELDYEVWAAQAAPPQPGNAPPWAGPPANPGPPGNVGGPRREGKLDIQTPK